MDGVLRNDMGIPETYSDTYGAARTIADLPIVGVMDYKKLLKKYMDFVMSVEGLDYTEPWYAEAERESFNFTNEELIELNKMSEQWDEDGTKFVE